MKVHPHANRFHSIPQKSAFCSCHKIFKLLIASSIISSPSHSTTSHQYQEESEQTATTITDEDFQKMVWERNQGLIGFHKNVDFTPMIPAAESAVLNWTQLSPTKKKHLISKQEKMFCEGKITMIVMAGGEATRFGGPKIFASISDDLGEFLQIKAANLNWMKKTYETNVPMYILSSEKRLSEFKKSLFAKNYYGFNPEDFRWFSQGTIDTFIPSDEELKANFKDDELNTQLAYASALRQKNPDGVYRFQGERRKVPSGHFDTIAAFMISGLFGEALERGVEYVSIVNIDNLQAILKNDGMIAYFAEHNNDIGFLLAEKNLHLTIRKKTSNKILQDKLIVRFRENILSFDGIQEFHQQTEKGDYRYVINQSNKTVDVYSIANGKLIDTEITVKPETGGTLVQPANEKGEPLGNPVMKEGFELPSNFNHVDAPFFNTNTIVLNLRSLLRLLAISQEKLAQMSFEERSIFIREKLIQQIKTYFEFKTHEVEGEYSEIGTVKNGKTKISVIQATRIILQAAHIRGAKIGYVFAPRASVFAPVKDPEDKEVAAQKNRTSLKQYLNYASDGLSCPAKKRELLSHRLS